MHVELVPIMAETLDYLNYLLDVSDEWKPLLLKNRKIIFIFQYS